MQIGAQLYTLFRQTTTLQGFENCLEKVAGMGYKVVQVSGTCAYEPEWLSDKLAKNDLKCVLTHIDPKRISEETEKVVSDHRIFGCNHIGIGGMPNEMRGSLEGYKEFKKIFLPAALKMRDMGAKLMYHNHWFEFDKLDGFDVIERIAEDFPEDALGFTLDLGWAAHAQSDVVKLINNLKGRLPIIHLKDYKPLPEDGSCNNVPVYLRPIYEGILDYDSYIKALYNAGCEYALVEQDFTYDEDPFDCLKRSFDNVINKFPEMK